MEVSLGCGKLVVEEAWEPALVSGSGMFAGGRFGFGGKGYKPVLAKSMMGWRSMDEVADCPKTGYGVTLRSGVDCWTPSGCDHKAMVSASKAAVDSAGYCVVGTWC